MAACTKPDTAKRPKHNNRNAQNETIETKRSKRWKLNERNDLNETTVLTKTNHYNNRVGRKMKYRGNVDFTSN